jgi:isoleucyl-tRNA synthetase
MEPLDQYILARTAELDAKIRKAYDDFEFHRAYHALNEYINSDLSALYLDVLKDRLYTFAPNARERRSAQTALWHIAEALARLVAPILSFTADEVWQSLPAVDGRESSVHIALFSDLDEVVPHDTTSLKADWNVLLAARKQVLLDLERARRDGNISNKSTEVNLTLVGGPKSIDVLNKYPKRSLEELFGVPGLHLETDESLDELANESPAAAPYFHVAPVPAVGKKCERCWRYVEDVAGDSRYPTVCLRCAEALDAIGYPPYTASNPTE